jgi:hypothetical protein
VDYGAAGEAGDTRGWLILTPYQKLEGGRQSSWRRVSTIRNPRPPLLDIDA